MQAPTISVALLADKYGLDECKSNVEFYLVQLATTATVSDLQYTAHQGLEYATLRDPDGTSGLNLHEFLLRDLIKLNMRFLAVALVPCYLRLLAEALKGDISRCAPYTDKPAAVKALKAYVRRVLRALAENTAPVARAVHLLMSTMLLNTLNEQS